MQEYELSFWSEYVSYRFLIPVIKKMGNYGIGLFQSIDPKRLDKFEIIYETCQKNNVPIALWPLLNPEDGYWLSSSNLMKGLKFIKKVIEKYPKIDLIALDFELPKNLNMIERNIAGIKSRKHIPKIQKELDQIVSYIKSMNVKVLETISPLFLGLQKFTGIVQTSDADYYSTMMYTSYYRSSFLKNIINKDQCIELVYDVAKHYSEKYGGNAAIDLGRISYGVNRNIHFPLHDIAQIKKEISAALAGGIKKIQLFALDDNIFKYRNNYDDFFEPLINCKPVKPPKNHLLLRYVHNKLI